VPTGTPRPMADKIVKEVSRMPTHLIVLF
jgi:hypothetical protein